MRVMLLGATGLVGGLALPMLLDDPLCRAIVAPTRRPLGLSHPKLHAPVLSFDALQQRHAAAEPEIHTTRRQTCPTSLPGGAHSPP